MGHGCCSDPRGTVGPRRTRRPRQPGLTDGSRPGGLAGPESGWWFDYPSADWRRSYARRTAAERANATIKDTASNNIARGWIRLMGLTPLMLRLACALAVRNQRILTAWDARQEETHAAPPPGWK